VDTLPNAGALPKGDGWPNVAVEPLDGAPKVARLPPKAEGWPKAAVPEAAAGWPNEAEELIPLPKGDGCVTPNELVVLPKAGEDGAAPKVEAEGAALKGGVVGALPKAVVAPKAEAAGAAPKRLGAVAVGEAPKGVGTGAAVAEAPKGVGVGTVAEEAQKGLGVAAAPKAAAGAPKGVVVVPNGGAAEAVPKIFFGGAAGAEPNVLPPKEPTCSCWGRRCRRSRRLCSSGCRCGRSSAE